MRVLMLGWEFPPFMAGGLGTACYGLTRALNRAGQQVLFVLPKPTGGAHAEHVHLLGADRVAHLLGQPGDLTAKVLSGDSVDTNGEGKTVLFPVEGPGGTPYGPGTVEGGSEEAERLRKLLADAQQGGLAPLGLRGLSGEFGAVDAESLAESLKALSTAGGGQTHYGKDLFGDAERYARVVAALAQRIDFDVVHANDWLSFPAGIAVKAATGKPMIAHVHATEFDRSGDNINQAVYDLERAGVHLADRTIAVSRLTKEILIHRYAADPERVDVVYNGVDDGEQPHAGATIETGDRIVLFLGRITMQKGPEYFIRAAKRVLEKVENVKFVVAGSGDMGVRMIEEAAHLGIGHKVLFTGFLRGRDVDRVFRMADCYVMPSVSEPFGIAALEALQRKVPVIISRQSGVSEVLSHALKVDFWDTDEMANKIVAVLRHPPLSQTLSEHGAIEVRRLTWDDAAARAITTYRRAMGVPWAG